MRSFKDEEIDWEIKEDFDHFWDSILEILQIWLTDLCGQDIHTTTTEGVWDLEI